MKFCYIILVHLKTDLKINCEDMNKQNIVLKVNQEHIRVFFVFLKSVLLNICKHAFIIKAFIFKDMNYDLKGHVYKSSYKISIMFLV